MAKSSTSALSVISGGSPEGAADDLLDAIKDYIDARMASMHKDVYEAIQQLREVQGLVKDGPPGPPGVGLAGMFIDRDGHGVVTMSDGTIRDLGVIVGKDGEPGMGFDDMSIALDGRVLTFRFVRGEKTREFKFTLPVPVYKEVYNPDETYFLGDMCTFGGSIWSCMAATTKNKPGAGNSDWKLAAKCGRDGRDGRSAYEIACEHGFRGSEKDWLKSLKGDRGPAGPERLVTGGG